MAKFCGKCGSPLNETAVFCGGCGNKIVSAAPAPAAPVAYNPVPPAAPVAPAYTPVASDFTPVPPAADPAAFAPIPSSFEPLSTTPTPEPTAFVPVASSVTPPVPPAPTPDPAGFTPVQGNFATPPPVPPATPPPYVPAAAPAAYAPVQTGYPPAQAAYTPAPAAYAPAAAYPAKKSNTLLKVVIAFVLVLFVGGALALGGLWYAAQKIKEKAHAAATQALNNSPTPEGKILGGVLSGLTADHATDEGDASGFKGDPCRFLTKEEVSKAVGVTVIRADAVDNGCNYIAHGDPADVTSKHMSSMIGGMGAADAKTQKQIQKIAGAFFAQQEASDKDLRAQAATGEIPVLGTIYITSNAELDMKMNRAAFQRLGTGGTAKSSGTGDLDGIGDEAYLAGGSMIIFRKGNISAHFTYISCPCNTDNIKPLAVLAASRM